MTKTIGVWRRVMLAATVIILAGLSAQQLSASVVAVGPCVANVVHFTSIQGAVNAVPPGSTIKICPASYPEQVVINKNLTLVGVNSGSADNPVLVIPAGGLRQTPRASQAVTPLPRRSWFKILPPQSPSAVSPSMEATTI